MRDPRVFIYFEGVDICDADVRCVADVRLCHREPLTERTTNGHRYAQINYCSIIRCDVEIWNLVPFLSCESYGSCQKFILMRLIFSLAPGENICYFTFTFIRCCCRVEEELSQKRLEWAKSHRNSMRNTAEL